VITINHNISVNDSVDIDQTTVNSGNTLTVNSGYTLTIYGSGTQLTVDGTLQVIGDVASNTGVVAYGANGTLIYAIETSRDIGPEFPSANGPYNVTLNTNGTRTITLTGSRTIDGTLTFTRGRIALGSNTLSLGTGASIAGSTSVGRMIIISGSGVLRKYFSGTGSFTFPLGDELYYSPVTVNFTSGTFDVNAYVSVNLSDSKFSNNSSTNDYINRYWVITQSNISSFSCNVTLQYVTDDIYGNEADIWCGHYNGSTWIIGNQANTSNHQLSATVTSFSTFTGGEQSAMPVHLLSLTYLLNNNNLSLNWITNEELNNSGFEIQRTLINIEDWKNLGFIPGNGTKNTPSHYSYTDYNVPTGKYKYRLKQIDYNGNYEYHYLQNAVEIGVPGKFNLSQNYPNPFNPVTKINFEIPKDVYVTLKIYDISGREVKSLVNDIRTAGYHTVEFNASNLASGIYFYTLKAGEFSKTLKMTLIK